MDTNPDRHPDGDEPTLDAAAPRWQRDPRALWRRSSARIIVLPPGQEQPLLLEDTAAVIFDLLADPVSTVELAALFSQATGVASTVIARDLTGFLDQLAAERVVLAS